MCKLGRLQLAYHVQRILKFKKCTHKRRSAYGKCLSTAARQYIVAWNMFTIYWIPPKVSLDNTAQIFYISEHCGFCSVHSYDGKRTSFVVFNTGRIRPLKTSVGTPESIKVHSFLPIREFNFMKFASDFLHFTNIMAVYALKSSRGILLVAFVFKTARSWENYRKNHNRLSCHRRRHSRKGWRSGAGLNWLQPPVYLDDDWNQSKKLKYFNRFR